MMNIPTHIKDLPEEGVRLISTFDASFDKRAAVFLKGPSALVDRVKPFSVLVENTGRVAIVGSRVVWEIVKSDGTVYRHYIGAANPWIFLGGNKTTQTTLGAAIPPHATRFVSLVGSAAEGEQVDLNTCELAFNGSPDELQAFNQALLRGDREGAFDKSSTGKVMAQATEINVSIDGIFFEDGTFVGKNQTGLYEDVKAFVDAEYDLASEIVAAQKQGKPPDEIVEQVTDFLAAHSQTGNGPLPVDRHGVRIERRRKLTSLASMKPTADAYLRYKAMSARTFLRQAESLGADEAVNEAVKETSKLLKRPRIELRRK